MPANDFIRDAKKALIWTIRAFDPWLLAHAANPFVPAGGLVTGAAGLPALETPGIHVVSSAKERAEQCNLGGGRGIVSDNIGAMVWTSNSLFGGGLRWNCHSDKLAANDPAVE